MLNMCSSIDGKMILDVSNIRMEEWDETSQDNSNKAQYWRSVAKSARENRAHHFLELEIHEHSSQVGV